MNSSITVQDMSLLELAKQVSGRDDIRGVEFIQDGKILSYESFYVDDLDLLPSVSFSLADVMEESDRISYASSDFVESISIEKFPGIT